MVTARRNSTQAGLGPVAKETLAGRVVLILKRFILMENLSEGDQLPSERTLAGTLDVSPRVVRQALSMLVSEGLIVKRHGSGAFVHSLDWERLTAEIMAPDGRAYAPADLHAARCALEIGAMYLVARNAVESDLTTLAEIVIAMQRRVERRESVAAEDLLFHQTLLRATHNAALLQLEHLIVESIRLDVYDQPGLLRRSIRDESHVIVAHRAVVEALLACDGDGAAHAMRVHLSRLLP